MKNEVVPKVGGEGDGVSAPQMRFLQAKNVGAFEELRDVLDDAALPF